VCGSGVSRKFIGGDGLVVFASDQNLLAYDPLNGVFKWELSSGFLSTGKPGSAPTVGDGTLQKCLCCAVLCCAVVGRSCCCLVIRVLFQPLLQCPDGTVYWGSPDGYVYSVDSEGDTNVRTFAPHSPCATHHCSTAVMCYPCAFTPVASNPCVARHWQAGCKQWCCLLRVVRGSIVRRRFCYWTD
jgi:hypothetical protein